MKKSKRKALAETALFIATILILAWIGYILIQVIQMENRLGWWN